VLVGTLHRRRLRKAAWLGALQTFLWVQWAAADTSVGDRIDVVVDGSQEDVQALTDALREPLQRLGLTVSSSGAGEDDAGSRLAAQPRARVWIDARGQDYIEIVVGIGSTDARRARRSVPRTEPGPVVVDQVAYVVRATLESLLSKPQNSVDASPGLPPEATRLPPAPVVTMALPTGSDAGSAIENVPPRSRAIESDALGFDIAAFATGRGFAKGASAVLGSGASVDLSFWGRQLFRPRLSVAASFDGTFESSGPVVNLRVSVWSMRLVPTLALLRWRSLRLDAGIGGGMDGFNASPAPAPGAPFPVASFNVATFVDPVVSGQVVLWLSPTDTASVLIGGYLDYDVAPPRYVTVDGSGQPTTAWEPWRWRPAVLAGLCIPLAGAGACGRQESRPP
jgi:hypothetical protein